jgi:hypothetical protein
MSKDEVYIDQSGNVYIDESGNTKLVFKVLKYQDIYRPEHLSSKYIKTFIVFIMATVFFVSIKT